MPATVPTLDPLTPHARQELSERWELAKEYFLRRKSVVFLSYCRFWEPHGFVQRSLAYALAEAGVSVVWLDGEGWRPYRPVVRSPHPNLKVLQLPCLPGRRWAPLDWWNLGRQARYCERLLKTLPGHPVIWVQAGIDERLAALLPRVDVFSVFDDPYRHSPIGDLCRKASVIVCQNPRALECVQQLHGRKSHWLLPPMEMSPSVFEQAPAIEFPSGFPSTVLGYVGSFGSEGFDLLLFEDFVRSFPQYGFVLAGRTDTAGAAVVERMKKYKNFVRFPWMERSRIASLWKRLSLSLLFYRPIRSQDGAFPVKVLESLAFGVPCVATAVAKTEALEGVFPRSSIIQVLKKSIEPALGMTADRRGQLYQEFYLRMHPKSHLGHVAEWLQGVERASAPTEEFSLPSLIR